MSGTMPKGNLASSSVYYSQQACSPVSHDGTYAPSCIAYADSNITLNNGECVWDKFTGEVVVNDEGEVVDKEWQNWGRTAFRKLGSTPYSSQITICPRRLQSE